MRVLGLCGSLRQASTNGMLLDAFARHAPEGVEIVRFALMADIPPFNPDIEGTGNGAVDALGRSIAECDGILIASPEYAHGIPGNLKNALDWMVSRHEIPGKPVMQIHASTRSLVSRGHLSEVLRTMSCRVMDAPTFELHLLGKTPAVIADLLANSDCADAMRQALCRFAAFAEGENGR